MDGKAEIHSAASLIKSSDILLLQNTPLTFHIKKTKELHKTTDQPELGKHWLLSQLNLPVFMDVHA